jgi:hypothetical protein
METVVEATPEQCVTALWEYFTREWPYEGTVQRKENGIVFLEKPPGMVSVLWRNAELLSVSALAEGEGRTRLYVVPGRRKYGQTLEKWLREQLPERAAAVEPSIDAAAPAATDIPDQIKKLAELRDSGAITEEEFERKKAELLDRM